MDLLFLSPSAFFHFHSPSFYIGDQFIFTPGDLDRTFYQLLFTCYFSPFSIKGIENAERDGNNEVISAITKLILGRPEGILLDRGFWNIEIPIEV